jgi:hypothetical protein
MQQVRETAKAEMQIRFSVISSLLPHWLTGAGLGAELGAGCDCMPTNFMIATAAPAIAPIAAATAVIVVVIALKMSMSVLPPLRESGNGIQVGQLVN